MGRMNLVLLQGLFFFRAGFLVEKKRFGRRLARAPPRIASGSGLRATTRRGHRWRTFVSTAVNRHYKYMNQRVGVKHCDILPSSDVMCGWGNVLGSPEGSGNLRAVRRVTRTRLGEQWKEKRAATFIFLICRAKKKSLIFFFFDRLRKKGRPRNAQQLCKVRPMYLQGAEEGCGSIPMGRGFQASSPKPRICKGQ